MRSCPVRRVAVQWGVRNYTVACRATMGHSDPEWNLHNGAPDGRLPLCRLSPSTPPANAISLRVQSAMPLTLLTTKDIPPIPPPNYLNATQLLIQLPCIEMLGKCLPF